MKYESDIHKAETFKHDRVNFESPSSLSDVCNSGTNDPKRGIMQHYGKSCIIKSPVCP